MKTIYANIWGEQKKVHLGTWVEIRKRGFLPQDRAFGTLNDGRQALFFLTGTITQYQHGYKPYNRWYVTTETLEDIYKKEHRYLLEKQAKKLETFLLERTLDVCLHDLHNE